MRFCRKMFIGGLSWQTTSGNLPVVDDLTYYNWSASFCCHNHGGVCIIMVPCSSHYIAHINAAFEKDPALVRCQERLSTLSPQFPCCQTGNYHTNSPALYYSTRPCVPTSDSMVQPQIDRNRFRNVSNLDMVKPNWIRDSIYTPAVDCYLLTFWHWKCCIHAFTIRWHEIFTRW